MKFNHKLQLSLLLVLLLMAMGGSFYLFFRDSFAYATIAFIGAAVFTRLIFAHYNRLVRKITLMFDAIDNSDNSLRFLNAPESSTADYLLNNALNRIKKTLLEAREEVQEQERYYEKILDQLNTGILVLNPVGAVVHINNKASELLVVDRPSHVNQLSIISESLPKIIGNLTSGQSDTVKFYNETTQVQLKLTLTELTIGKRSLRVVTISDIYTQINQAEVDSWSRISRVLTHEIMNSLSPIISLSETLVQSNDQSFVRRGLQIIAETALGLSRFVENYRSFSRLSVPNLARVDVVELVKRELTLFAPDAEVDSPEGSEYLEIDQGMISQVLSNLLKNAQEAVQQQGSGKVWVKIGRDANSSVFVDVCNDGYPISDEIREDIFVPFFTTKDNGNGIGLALSRQIMRLHHGSISLTTRPFTRFRITF